MNHTIINHCKPGGSGCSKCVSCNDPESQRLCSFYVKAQYENRCSNTKFDEYCSCTYAQDNAMGKEVPLDKIPNKPPSLISENIFELTEEMIRDLQIYSQQENKVKRPSYYAHNYDKFIDPPTRRRDYSRDPARHPSSGRRTNLLDGGRKMAKGNFPGIEHCSAISESLKEYVKRCERKEEKASLFEMIPYTDGHSYKEIPYKNPCAEDIYEWLPHYIDNSGSMSIDEFDLIAAAWKIVRTIEVEKLEILFNEGRVMYHNFLGWYYDTQTEIFYDNQGVSRIPTEKDLRRFTEDPFHNVQGQSYWL